MFTLEKKTKTNEYINEKRYIYIYIKISNGNYLFTELHRFNNKRVCVSVWIFSRFLKYLSTKKKKPKRYDYE